MVLNLLSFIIQLSSKKFNFSSFDVCVCVCTILIPSMITFFFL